MYQIIVVACDQDFHFKKQVKQMQENMKVRGKALREKERRATLSFPARHLAWENIWHLAILPLVSLPNDVWEIITHHYPDLGSVSDWSCRLRNLIQPIRSTTQIWVVTRHQCGISALISQTSFGRETRGSFAKRWLFSQATCHLHASFCVLLVCGFSWYPPNR